MEQSPETERAPRFVVEGLLQNQPTSWGKMT